MRQSEVKAALATRAPAADGQGFRCVRRFFTYQDRRRVTFLLINPTPSFINLELGAEVFPMISSTSYF